MQSKGPSRVSFNNTTVQSTKSLFLGSPSYPSWLWLLSLPRVALCLITRSCPILCDPMDCSPPGPSVHGDSPGKNTGVGRHALLQGIFLYLGIQPRSPALQVDSLLSQPPGKSTNTGMDSLSLLQRIFLTQELNWGLLHCRWIFYQLSYQGSPCSL